MKQTPIAAVAMLAAGAALAAQETATTQIRDRVSYVAQAAAQARTMAVESRITRGAPYSGETVTDSFQVLADGTRIVKKTVSRIYRDSQGRTRRERLDPSGNVVDISISDPVAESTYILDPRTKSAFRNGVVVSWSTGQVSGSVDPGSNGVVVATRMPDGSTKVETGDGAATGGARVGGAEVKERTAVAVGGGRGRGDGSGAGRGGGVGGSLDRITTPEHAEWATAINYPPVPGAQTVTEDLGQQMMEGVLATGKRTKTIIPLGAIGNDQPIEILTEQWMSSELSVLVMTKHSDPRSGVTSYNLTNIIRAEQPQSLFEVPADYTLKDSVIRRKSPSMQ
jgi:hypothetical protein